MKEIAITFILIGIIIILSYLFTEYTGLDALIIGNLFVIGGGFMLIKDNPDSWN